MPEHLLQQTPEQLLRWCAARDLPGYRARQVWRWLLEKGAASFDEMSDLPLALRGQLAEQYVIWTSKVVAERLADDGTCKLLLELVDHQRIECVLLGDDRGRHTACISTQVGCAMGCAFCASGLDGVVRNLTTGEILEQLLQLRRRLQPSERMSNIVVMGMGEPLANLPALVPALDLASSPKGLGISGRRITVSTVGMPTGIRRLADLGCPYHLAVSLHAPDDELRNRLVPTNRKIGIAAILEAADYYFERTGRRITYEYVLLGAVNDQPEHARRLAELMRGRAALVNVIPYNPVRGLAFAAPSARSTARFVELLEQGGVAVKIRYRKGDRIDAACGQLRRGTSGDSALGTGNSGSSDARGADVWL